VDEAAEAMGEGSPQVRAGHAAEGDGAAEGGGSGVGREARELNQDPSGLGDYDRPHARPNRGHRPWHHPFARGHLQRGGGRGNGRLQRP
jgi:hypothetical protein